MKNFSDPILALIAVGIALNTVMVMNRIVTENHTLTIINALSGAFLIFAYGNRKEKNDE